MNRLDLLLVSKNLCESRSQAQAIIQSGQVAVNGETVTKCGQKFGEDVEITVLKDAIKYVSRGGLKLEGAIKEFNLDFNGITVLDVGSSTGGFCDCALKFGAKQVIAVDVGVNQLHKSLKTSEKVLSFEGTDIRDFNIPKNIKPTLLVGDLSFISLSKILPHISRFKTIQEYCLLVKPQFECGQEIARKHKGIINDLNVHKSVLLNVWKDFEQNNLIVINLAISPISGGDGNIEYLIYAKPKNLCVTQLTESEKMQKINYVLDLAKQKMSQKNKN